MAALNLGGVRCGLWVHGGFSGVDKRKRGLARYLIQVTCVLLQVMLNYG